MATKFITPFIKSRTTTDEDEEKQTYSWQSSLDDFKSGKTTETKKPSIIDTFKTNLNLSPKERIDKVLTPLKGAKLQYGNIAKGISQVAKEGLEVASEGKGLVQTVFPSTTDYFKKGAETAETNIQDFQKKLDPLESYGSSLSGIDSLAFKTGQQLPNLAGALVSPAASLATMGVGAGGQKTREIEQQGGTQTAQRLGGFVSGAAEVATELIPMQKITKMLGGTGGIKDFLVDLGFEAGGEMLTQAIDPYINKATIPDYKLADMQSQISDIKQAGFDAVTTSILIGGIANGIGSVTNAVKSPTTENVQKAVQDVQVDAQAKGITIDLQNIVQDSKAQTGLPQVPTLPISQAKVLTNAEINNMKQPTIISELENIGESTEGTRSELRKRLKVAQFKTVQNEQQIQEPIAPLQQQPNAIVSEEQQNAPIAQQQSESDSIAVMPEYDTENTQVIPKTLEEAKILVKEKALVKENVTIPKTLDEAKAIVQSKSTMNEDVGLADSQGASMIVRLDTLKADVKTLKESNVMPNIMDKYEKLLNEIFDKGVSRASKNQIAKLITIENSVKGLKLKHKQAIADVKAKNKETKAKLSAKRKESATRTKLLKLRKEVNKGKFDPELQKAANDLIGDIDPKSKSMTTGTRVKLEAIQTQIEKLTADGAEIDPSLIKSAERLNQKQISDLSIDEVENLIDLISNIKLQNKLLKETRTKLKHNNRVKLKADIVGDIGATSTDPKELNSLSGLKDFLIGTEASTPKNVFLELGKGNENSSAYSVFKMLRKSQDTELSNKFMLEDMLTDKLGKDYKEIASTKEWNAEQDVNGVKLTSGEKVFLKAARNDDNVLQSIEEKGYLKGNSVKPVRLSREFIDNITLNETEQKALDIAPDFFEATYDLLNEAHVQNKGYALKKADKGKYFPKKVSDLTLQEDIGKMFIDASLSNTGVIQDRKGSLNVVKMQDIFDVYERQKQISTKFNAYVNPLDDVNKIMLSPEVKTALRSKYGTKKDGQSPVEVYVRDLIQDLQGTRSQATSGIDAALKTIRTNAAPAILAYRMTTPMLQTMSYPIALGEVSAKNLAKGIATKPNFEEMWANNNRARARKEGRIDRELAESSQKKLTDLGMKPIAFMDKQTIGRLWEATKLEIKDTNPNLKGQEYLDAVSDKFNDVLDTQPNYTTLERSGSLRESSELSKAATMFGSAKNAVLNELKRGYTVAKETGDTKLLNAKIKGFSTSIVGMAAIRMLVKELKDKEQDPSAELLNSLLGSLPGLDLLTQVFKGYDVGVMGLDTFNDLGSSVSSLWDIGADMVKGEDVSKTKVYNTIRYTIDSLSLIYGVPVANIRDDFQVLFNSAGLGDEFKEIYDPATSSELKVQIKQARTEGDTEKVTKLNKRFRNLGK